MFLAIVALSVLLTFVNGLQDASNAVTTSIVTKTLPDRTARAYAAALNMLGIFFGVLLVAFTEASLLTVVGFPGFVAQVGANLGPVLLVSLIVCTSWQMLAYFRDIPVSGWNSTLAALVGAALAGGAGAIPAYVLWGALVPIIFSPLLGGAVSYVATRALQRLRYQRVVTMTSIRVGQTMSAGLVAAGHGMSNGRLPLAFMVVAGMGMSEGVITLEGPLARSLADTSAGSVPLVPWWLLVAFTVALGAGTFIGGRRLVMTLGRRLTNLTPAQGLASEATTASLMSIVALGFGAPISSTYTLTGSIVGAALAISRKSLAWSVLGKIVAWWLLTPVACAGTAALVVTVVL